MENGYKVVTERIIEQLNQGIIPWQRGWSGAADGAYNYYTKKPYSLLNQLMLKHQDAYISYKQTSELGGKVKKGAKSEKVVYWNFKVVEDTEHLDADGNPKKKTIPFLKPHSVFWIEDTTLEREDIKRIEHDPIKEAEDIISGYVEREASLQFINDKPSNRAYYSPLRDTVVVPMLSQFEHPEEYYSTAFHELTHSTGSPTRLERMRLTELAAFGSEKYSKEELVAELGAAMLVNNCGIESERSFRNSAGYIQGWLEALNNDQRLIVSAASRAEKAVKYILTGEKGSDEK